MDLEGIHRFAAQNHGLVDRATIWQSGGTDEAIAARVESGHWSQIHAGVYRIGVTPLTWRGRLRAATLAAGPLAAVSHRTATQLWGLQGVAFSTIELTVPVGHLPTPKHVIVHRTRRPMEYCVVDAIPVVPVERAILDSAAYVPTATVEQLYDSGIRQSLTHPEKMAECLYVQGKKGVKGRSKVIAVLDGRRSGPSLGSPAETFILRRMRLAGIEEPERQFVLILPDGTVAVLDFAWPGRVKAIEIDGLDAHSSARQLELDLVRQNLIFGLGWQLRRFSGRMVMRHPALVVQEIAHFLAA
jgi:very-short-patch-repair endonuclease